MAQTPQNRQNSNSNVPASPIQITGLGHPQITLKPQYQALINKVPALVKNASQWMTNVDVTKMTENQITELRRRLRKVTHLKNSIKKGIKANRKFFNDFRDRSQALFIQKMKPYHLDQLEALGQKATRLNRQILANRANQRWHSLKPAFDTDIQTYPVISKYAPQLANFSRFRIMNPSLVSRAKSKPVTKDTVKKINDTVHQWASNVKLIADNPYRLTPQGQNRILNGMIQDPSSNAADTIKINMKDLKTQEDQAAKQAKTRQQQILKQKQDAKRAQAQQKKNQPKKPNTKLHATADPFMWLSDLIQSSPALQAVKDQDKLKADLIILAAKNSFVPNTIWSNHIKGDAGYFVKLISYILSL